MKCLRTTGRAMVYNQRNWQTNSLAPLDKLWNIIQNLRNFSTKGFAIFSIYLGPSTNFDSQAHTKKKRKTKTSVKSLKIDEVSVSNCEKDFKRGASGINDVFYYCTILAYSWKIYNLMSSNYLFASFSWCHPLIYCQTHRYTYMYTQIIGIPRMPFFFYHDSLLWMWTP